MSWIVRETGFRPEAVTTNGNKFMIGNGRYGYRGTLDEFTKEELTATTVAGLYDQVGTKWREPVNVPNGLSTRIFANNEQLSVLHCTPKDHIQELDMRQALHKRTTIYQADNTITFRSERFASMDQLPLLVSRMSVHCSQACQIVIEAGIDGDVWDINGPHLEQFDAAVEQGCLVMSAVSQELRHTIVVAESIQQDFGTEEIISKDKEIFRRITIDCEAGKTYEWVRYVSIHTSLDEVQTPWQTGVASCVNALSAGYDQLLVRHQLKWDEKWELSDVQVEGEDEAQSALRYSIYQLLIIAPYESERVSIPARGLSGQVYKGAVFWDTEMFMLPFFLFTQPDAARNLMMYRVHTLEGARRKAAEYGFEGAFYAWESQDSGEDACTLFNVNDVFTGRRMRTYFRDKQVHISADVVYGIWQYYAFTGDIGILLDGGAEVIWACARFFYSYGYYNPGKRRYEILDVTGPDEYHERVHNNAFTNYMVKHSLKTALLTMELLESSQPELVREILAGGGAEGPTLQEIRQMHDSLYIQKPGEQNGVIEQFDGYFRLEDTTLSEVKSRVIHPNEYWGGGNGIAVATQIIKQADVVLMLHLFKEAFPAQVKKANWEYYEPRTEHGSSLSPCVYALVASDIGAPDWAYPYFMRTATIDLTGESKQYVGDLYIGGTHPAANGGAWMAAVLGFAGLSYENGVLHIRPQLPAKWSQISFSVSLQGQRYRIEVSRDRVTVSSLESGTRTLQFTVNGDEQSCGAAQAVEVAY